MTTNIDRRSLLAGATAGLAATAVTMTATDALAQAAAANYQPKPLGLDPKSIKGIVMDDLAAKVTGDWKESGAAGLKPPGTHGFGMTIIRRSLEASRGVVSVDYGAQGLACRIELPLEDENGDGFQLMPA